MTLNRTDQKKFYIVEKEECVCSILYEDGVRKVGEGINQLPFAIITSLKDDQLVVRCYTITDNQSFWSTISLPHSPS